MAGKKLEGAGLRGQVAGKTSLSTVGKAGKGLTYRGYEIEVLAEKAFFEEVAYMLLYGNLPNQEEFNTYSAKLKLRVLPSELSIREHTCVSSSYGCDENRLFYVR